MISAEIRRSKLNAFIAGGAAGAAEATGNKHAITDIRAFAVPVGGNTHAYSVLEIMTRSGVKGYGECRPLTHTDVQALRIAIGKPAYAYESLTPMAPKSAQGGLNMALLDIVGKMTGAPAYRVIGGPTRFKVRVVSPLSGSSTPELLADLQKKSAAGAMAFMMPIAKPAALNQGSLFVKTHVDRFKALRAAAPSADFAVASHDQLTPGDAAVLAAALEPLHPLWFDEPCSVENLDTIRKISQETVVPLAFGRGITEPGVFQNLLRERLIDLVRPDLLTYGISGCCRIAAMAETYYTAVAPWHDAGPIATAAAMHAAAAMPNFFALQLPASGTENQTLQSGFLQLPTAPGLGITVDTKPWEGSRIA